MPLVETTFLNEPYGEYSVERRNTLIDGYVPVKSEIIGLKNVVVGASWYLSGLFAYVTNQRLGFKGKCLFKDGCVNLIFSPITWLVLGTFAYLKYRSASVPPVSTARWSFSIRLI